MSTGNNNCTELNTYAQLSTSTSTLPLHTFNRFFFLNFRLTLCGTWYGTVWPAATYGYEDWMIRKSKESQIAAFQNEWVKADPMDSQEKKQKGSRKSWNKNSFVSNRKDKEVAPFWSHHETSVYRRISFKKPYQEREREQDQRQHD